MTSQGDQSLRPISLRDINVTHSFLIAVLLGAVSAALYLASAWFEFVYDDVLQVLDNPSIRSWHYIGSWFTSPILTSPFYRPTFSLWFRLNYGLFGTHPIGWHLASILANAAAVVLAYFLVKVLSKNSTISIVAAVIFLVHPVHVENVAWVSGVCDLLMAIFFYAAFLCYLKGREQGPRLKWTASAMILYVLALLSKEPAITFSAVVAVHAFLFVEGSWRRRVWAAVAEAIPYAAVVPFYLWARVMAIHSVAPTANPLDWRSLLLTQPALLFFYTKKLFWPTHLAVFHDLDPVQTAGIANFYLPAAVLLLLLFAVVAWARLSGERSRLIGVAGAWTILTLAPALYIRSFARQELVHDRYLYLPSLGFAILAGVAFEQLLVKTRINRKACLAAGAAVVLLLGVANVEQQLYWANDLVLYTRGLAVAPHNLSALNNLARVLADRGDYAAAGPLFKELLHRDANAWPALYNLGFMEYKAGRNDEAERDLRRSLESYEPQGFAHLYLGLTYMRQGKLDQAEHEIRRAIAIRGDRPGHHLALSVLLEAKGDHKGALAEAQEEMAISPGEEASRWLVHLQTQP